MPDTLHADQDASRAAGTPPGGAYFDVLIVGAGLSGIGAAWHLQRGCPGMTYAILEARAAMGGTWDLFRYPGVRSDSDMYTLGYGFRPWLDGHAIADGPSIRRYIAQTAVDAGIDRHVRYGHRVVAAHWDSGGACWLVEAEHGGRRVPLRTRFLYMCSGYYSYDEAYRPRFDGEETFAGRIVQPQFWPAGLDYGGRRVVVVGSGATAVTLVPAMAQDAAHVTMLQRSPSYVVSRPSEYGFARRLRRWLPARAAYALTRWRVIVESMLLYRVARTKPDVAKRKIIEMARRQLGPGCDVDTHFTPDYKPWDQRVCIVPDGDLFRAIRAGRASVATDRIARFVPEGLLLESGQTLPADIVVLATGLKVKLMGGVAITVDGRPFHGNDAMSYKGMMLSGLPNCVMTFGYTNASWTLKADLTAAWVVRLLRHMARKRVDIVVAHRDPGVQPAPFLGFTSGYVQRARDELPRQGSRRPWQVHQNYLRDMLTIRLGRIADGVLRFGRKGAMP
ncbi:NAD(P)/FAD-dependent oxidoreductase [Massilia sp. TW-1]|uniref:NAD(P)/FAD-dependent oxidoreductase n=1 Tax=Telluria antibiotica TaxID=2717319 RepID=A0ABX0PBN2_9BURK|nr:NAD(P)/FAD-dependent oxidoreductase [Telluria antibiotica]NIA54281.1 NAD(P)/FAD-dependent oxidoreductase [Telluria antibiotica]